jgi:LPXTG-motif cell wall-anchored protein
VNVKKIRALLVTAILFAVAIRMLLWAVEPFIPYLVAGLVLVGIFGFFYYRKTKW